MVAAARRLEFIAGPDEAGERFDRACATRFASEGISRSTISKICDAGEALVASKPVKASTRLREGDHVVMTVPPIEPVDASPEDIPLAVMYEDDALMVIDKPAGLVVHPARGHWTGTLVNAVLFHANVEDDETPLRPGIVHRLDKGTSGVMVVAKTGIAREGLKAQFQVHSIERSYVAITVGVPPEATVYDTLHGRHPTDRMRFTTRVTAGKRAVTRVSVMNQLAGGKAAWVRCALETGRTHQIRVHLSEAGFPLLGDPLYGRRPHDVQLRQIGEKLGRQALHAEVLGFEHPISKVQMRFVAPIPTDLADALATLS